MDHVEFLREYERKLGRHSWEAVADLIHDDAVFIFSDGTFRGKQQIAGAFRRTFATIQNEEYTIRDVHWIVEADHVAACIYEFGWSGVVDGRRASGGGRGTTILVKTPAGWRIVHEHLGPHAK
jgi:ketosteroid isomerase-like protein